MLQGDTKGFAAEVRGFYVEADTEGDWLIPNEPANKPRLRHIAYLATQSRLSVLEKGTPHRQGREPHWHLSFGSPKQIGLAVTMRLGACALAGNKVAREDGPPEGICVFCAKGIEDEPHVIIECDAYEQARELMWKDLAAVYPESQIERLKDRRYAGPSTARLLGLSNTTDLTLTKVIQDKAVKTFLEHVATEGQHLRLLPTS